MEVVDGLERDDDHSDRDDHDDHQSEHSDQDQGQGDHEEGKCSAVHLLSFNLFCSSFMHPLDTWLKILQRNLGVVLRNNSISCLNLLVIKDIYIKQNIN